MPPACDPTPDDKTVSRPDRWNFTAGRRVFPRLRREVNRGGQGSGAPGLKVFAQGRFTQSPGVYGESKDILQSQSRISEGREHCPD
jgi:hypothetical protein